MREASNVTPLHPSEAPDLRDEMRAIMASDRKLSQAQIARETGISSSALNQWFGGKYAGDNVALESKLHTWLDALRARQSAGDSMPSAPEFVTTSTAQRVIAALSYAQLAGDIAIVYGGAGLGKTSAIANYVLGGLNVWHATMTPASSSVACALEVIGEVLGVAEVGGGAAKLHRAIVRKVRNTNGLLVIDEAQHCSVSALDQIRSIHDATGIGLAFVGNTELYARMTGGNRAASLDRLFSRIGKRLHLRQATEADIESMISAWGIEDAKCRGTLHEIARKPGALRTFTKVMRLASMLALSQKTPVCCDHVGKAWRELGGAE